MPMITPWRASVAVLSLAAAAVLGAGGCASSGTGAAGAAVAMPPRPAAINHVVFFKLSDPALAGELIADCETMAAEIPGIVSCYAGRHLDTGRETVDGDYDVGFYVGFDTEEAYAGYVEHAAHQALVAEWRSHLDWFRVYDVLDE